MNDDLGRIWKETVAVSFEILSQQLPGGTEEKREKP
jgi:hypothetical protein